MKIVNEIREDRVYYYLPKSEEELREMVKLGTFDDVIKTAKCLNTWLTPLDDAKKVIAELPEKHLVFESKLNKDSMIFCTRKGRGSCGIFWHTFCEHSFCTLVVDKVKLRGNKLEYFERVIVAGEKEKKLHEAFKLFIDELRISKAQASKFKKLPIWSIHASYNCAFEFMDPKCDFVKYELFKNALIDAIREAIPKEIFDDFSLYL